MVLACLALTTCPIVYRSTNWLFVTCHVFIPSATTSSYCRMGLSLRNDRRNMADFSYRSGAKPDEDIYIGKLRRLAKHPLFQQYTYQQLIY